jgi:hypothetical protein
VRAGEKAPISLIGQQRTPTSLLSHARDWEADFDLPEYHTNGSVFGFPYEVCATTLRVDAYIISRASKTCIAGPELTAPMEENISQWHKIKTDKYNSLRFADANDWRVHTLTLEVGARGFIPPSFRTCLRKLGFTSPEIKNLSNACSLMAQKCSYIIWINSGNKLFVPARLSSTIPSISSSSKPPTARS